MRLHFFICVFEDRVEYGLVDVRAARDERAARAVMQSSGWDSGVLAVLYCGEIDKEALP